MAPGLPAHWAGDHPCVGLSSRAISTFQGPHETGGSPVLSSPRPAAGMMRLLVAAAGGLIMAANDYHIKQESMVMPSCDTDTLLYHFRNLLCNNPSTFSLSLHFRHSKEQVQ